LDYIKPFFAKEQNRLIQKFSSFSPCCFDAWLCYRTLPSTL